MIGSELTALYTVGPQNWEPSHLVPYRRVSTDGGQTWRDVSLASLASEHAKGLPASGGKDFTLPSGRVVLPGRMCLLYSDDAGISWTATQEFAETVETKVQPNVNDGEIAGHDRPRPWRARGRQLYVRHSVDEGRTWTEERLITASAPSARYSDIAVTDAGTVVVDAAPVRVVRFGLDWLAS